LVIWLNSTVYSKELLMALKKAHKVCVATLDPKSIEKTSVKLAVSDFCESTHASWPSTADFITLMLKLWNILYAKTSSKGKHKRDYTMDPVRSSLDWKLSFL